MKLVIWVVAGMGLLFGAFMLLSSPSSEPRGGVVQAESSTPTMEQVRSDMANGSLFLDVRTAEEYSAGYFEGAQLIPLADLQAGKFPEVDPEKPLYIYCRSGNRSAEASAILKAAGYTNVIDLGGLQDVAAIGGRQIR